MAKVNRKAPTLLTLTCDDPQDAFTVRETNRGEPFRQGLDIGLSNREFEKEVQVMLEDSEAKQLQNFLNARYPENY